MIENDIFKYLGSNYPQSILFLYLPFAFALMLTIFNYKHFLKKTDDFRAFFLYFSFFFLTFLLIPVLIISLIEKDPLTFLNNVGFSLGKIKIGIPIAVIGFPISILVAFIGSKDPKMKQQYPFSKVACQRLSRFIIFEVTYLFLYYFPYEFIFRGFIFFSLLASFDLVIALSLQTIVSTLYHIGHPNSEIIGALFAGFIFGIIAYVTDSFLYAVIIHASIGISNDIFLYLRYHRAASKENNFNQKS